MTEVRPRPAPSTSPSRVPVWLTRAGSVALWLAVLGGVAGGGYATRDRWLPLVRPPAETANPQPDAHPHDEPPPDRVTLSPQAQANLKLTPAPLKPESYWKAITVPGVVIDRPGATDRGIVAPAAGVVTRIEKYPGDVVEPGSPLFTLRLVSEATHVAQTDLFKATQDVRLAEEQRKRLAGTAPEARIIEIDNQLARLQTAIRASRQELLSRGLTDTQIDAAAAGTFVRDIVVTAPARPANATDPPAELQDLNVDLGQQVTPGQSLAVLAHHQHLAVEGRAFRDETPLLENAVRENWPVAVDFLEDPAAGWPTFDQTLTVRYLSNTIDPASRTFAFRLPLENQHRTVTRDSRTVLLWRFRPGHQVRLRVRVEKLDGVFVLPPAAVVREGGEAYVFVQNDDEFVRKPVHVVHQDRDAALLADDGAVPAGAYVARGGAMALNRMLKALTAGGGGHHHDHDH